MALNNSYLDLSPEQHLYCTVQCKLINVVFVSVGFKPIQNATEHSFKTEDNKEKGETGKPVASAVVPGTGWHVVWTENSRHFFFNPTSKTSIWEKPVELESDVRIDEIIKAGPDGRKEGIMLLFVILCSQMQGTKMFLRHFCKGNIGTRILRKTI